MRTRDEVLQEFPVRLFTMRECCLYASAEAVERMADRIATVEHERDTLAARVRELEEDDGKTESERFADALLSIRQPLPTRVAASEQKESLLQARDSERIVSPVAASEPVACNRKACRAPLPSPRWWNTSTRAYYCDECMHAITRWPENAGIFEDHAHPSATPKVSDSEAVADAKHPGTEGSAAAVTVTEAMVRDAYRLASETWVEPECTETLYSLVANNLTAALQPTASEGASDA